MTDRIGEMIRRNRLLALRECLWEGTPLKYPDDFKPVFTWLDFKMVDDLFDDYVRYFENKPRVSDVSPASVRWFIRENRKVGDGLSLAHAEWNRIRTKPMSRAIREQALEKWREDRRALLARVRGLRSWLATAPADDLRYIAVPDITRLDDKFTIGDILNAQRLKRWSWYYWYEHAKAGFTKACRTQTPPDFYCSGKWRAILE